MKINDIEFDHVFRILDDRTIAEAPSGIWAPDFRNNELFGQYVNGKLLIWQQFSYGYTGQYGVATPMHNSEYVGGQLERDILDTPGIYCMVVCYWDCENEECDGEECEECSDGTAEGWAVARLEDESFDLFRSAQ